VEADCCEVLDTVLCGVGAQTQDFTKTFGSSQTGNKGPTAGMTLDISVFMFICN